MAMKIKLVHKIVACVFILIGVALVSNPELVCSKPIPVDTFQAVEKRIWWGLFIGVGTFLLFHHHLRPWLQTVAATCAALLAFC